jgi:hypothetical protein
VPPPKGAEYEEIFLRRNIVCPAFDRMLSDIFARPHSAKKNSPADHHRKTGEKIQTGLAV